MNTNSNEPAPVTLNSAGGVPPTTSCDPLPDDAPHVLVVDDDERIRNLLSRYLSTNGFRVTPAADAAIARAAMSGLQFDIVILDVMMPGENGLDLARFLKSQSDVPICMLTAQAEVEVGDEEATGELFIRREEAEDWYGALNQARLGLESRYEFGQLEQIEGPEDFPDDKRYAYVRSQFYSSLQSVLLEYVLE